MDRDEYRQLCRDGAAAMGKVLGDGWKVEPVTERTPEGEQILVPGVRPITERERLERLANRPLQPRKPQRACDVGLFDADARKQSDLF